VTARHFGGALLLLVLPLAASAQAPADVKALAQETGLTVSEVQMVFGARTTHMEYMTSFERAQRRAIQTLGMERYNELVAGGVATQSGALTVR